MVSCRSTPEYTSGFILAVEVDDGYAVLIAFGRGVNVDILTQRVYPIVATFETGEFDQPGVVTDGLPNLRYFNSGNMDEDEWERAVAELEELDLIPEGGELVYNEMFMVS